MRTVRTALVAAVAIASMIAAVAVNAGPYAFDYKNVNDMRKAYRICKISNYQDGDCPKVWEKCHMYPMIDWDGDSKCRKPPRFTDKNADARQALADGNAQSGQAPIPVPVTAQQDAQALDETTNNENPCTAAVDYAACSEALAHDEAGIETYEATEGVLADDPLQVAATAAQNGQVVVSSIVRTYDDGTTVIEATDLIEDNSHLDAAGNSAEYTAYETEYGLPDMESAPESESLPEPGPGTVTP